MLTVDQLIAFSPDQLHTDADAWQRLADQLGEHGQRLHTGVGGLLTTDSWDGSTATAARAHLDRLAVDYDGHGRRMAAVVGTLRGAAARFGAARSALVAARSTAHTNGLVVASDGTVTVGPVAAASADPGRRAVLAAMAGRLTADIGGVLTVASEVDTATAAALRGDATELMALQGGTVTTFGGPGADAEEAAAMVSDGISGDELPVLLEIFARNEGDPAFAGAFYGELGPDGTFLLVYQLAEFGYSNEDAAAAQAALGPMLAQVTDPASSGYLGDAWTQDLLRTDRDATQFQALGVMLGDGDFSTEFLVAAGDALETVEDGDGTNWPYAGPFDVDLDPASNGFDPLSGYLQALGRNPDAAELFFDPAAHPGRVEYYLSEREGMPSESVYSYDPDNDPGGFRDHVGVALEAAVSDDPHSAVSAHIMSETVYVLGDADKLNGDVPANMRDSVATMLAEYIGDVNASISHDQTPDYSTVDPVTGELVFDTDFDADIVYQDGIMATPAGDEAHARFDLESLMRTMGGVTEDPDAYAVVYEAQARYTALVLDTTAGDTSMTEDERIEQLQFETDQCAKVFGALDEGRATAVEDLYTSGDADHNEQVGLAEKAVGTIAGLVADEVLDAIPGDGIIKAGLGPLIGLLFGERDSDEAMYRAVAEVYHGGSRQAFEISRLIMENHGLWEQAWGLQDASSDGYNDGAAMMDQALPDP